MIPFLLYVPPLLGVGRFDVKTVAAITMVQVLVAAVSGVVAHGRHRAVNPRLAWVGGLTMAVGSLAGAVASKHVPHRVLLIVFALMVLPDPPADITTPAEAKPYRRRLIMAVTGGVGLAAGLVGAGGAFLLVPLLLVVVGVPIRVTIGSSLAITAFAATAGVAGKLATHQVPLVPALLVALGALPGAQLGVLASQRLSGVALKRILFLVIVLTGVRVWWDVLVD